MTRLDRRALFATGSAAALLSAAGISLASTPARGGHLRIALSGASRDDLWHPARGLFLNVAHRAVFDGLTEIAADGTLQGELAVSWSARDDARVWAFDLRPDVAFHDGSTMTASDVVASLAHHPRVADIRQTAALSVEIELFEADSAFPFKLADTSASIRPSGQQDSDSVIGTGLYRLDRYAAGREIRARRVESHYKDGRAGWFESIEIASIPDAKVRIEALIGGYVDVADISEPTALMGRPDMHVLTSKAASVAVREGVHHPGRIGQGDALDDARIAERWWMPSA